MPKTNQPTPVLENVAETKSDVAEKVIAINTGKRTQTAADILNEKRSKALQGKATLMQDARQKLAEAADLSNEGEDKADEAQQTAAEAAKLLYQGLTSNVVSYDEITAALGDTFGYRLKGDASVRVSVADPKASKTPFGLGESIRKRIKRAHLASTFVNTGEAPAAFFEPLDVDDVQPLVNDLNKDDGLTIWQVYDRLGDLKADAADSRSRAKPAFDAGRIAAMTRDLGSDVNASVESIASNRDLFESWVELLAMADVIMSDERLIKLAEAA